MRENRLRRMADRRGFRLVKSRVRDDRAPSHGMYMLIDLETGGAAAGSGPFGPNADLDEIEEALDRLTRD